MFLKIIEVMQIACQKENDSKILLKFGLLGSKKNSKDKRWESWDYLRN